MIFKKHWSVLLTFNITTLACSTLASSWPALLSRFLPLSSCISSCSSLCGKLSQQEIQSKCYYHSSLLLNIKCQTEKDFHWLILHLVAGKDWRPRRELLNLCWLLLLSSLVIVVIIFLSQIIILSSLQCAGLPFTLCLSRNH